MSKPEIHEIVQHIMESSGVNDVAIANIMKSSIEEVAAVVKGERAISKKEAIALGEYFKVSPELFIAEDNS